MNHLFRPFLVLIWLTASSHCVLERAHVHSDAWENGIAEVASGESARAFQLQFHHHHVPNAAHAHSVAHLLQIEHSGDFGDREGSCENDHQAPLSHTANDCDIAAAQLQSGAWTFSEPDGLELDSVSAPYMLGSLELAFRRAVANARLDWTDRPQFLHRFVFSTRRAQAPPLPV